MNQHVFLDVVTKLIVRERSYDSFLERVRLRCHGAVTWLEPILIVGTEIFTTTADDHLGTPFSRLVQSVANVQVVCLLAFIVSVANQYEPAVEFQLRDLAFCEITHPELFGDHVAFWIINGWQVDMERDRVALPVGLPQVMLEFSVECRLACPRVSQQKEHHLITAQELVNFLHQWKTVFIASLQSGFSLGRDVDNLL
jgi:hypothetical protein